MKFMMLFLVIGFLFGVACHPVVRDAKVYRAELDFVDAASEETVARGKAVIASSCACEEIQGVKVFSKAECRDLAETILVVEARMGYHTAFMRFLGGVSKTEPPKDPPNVPEPETLCK
jgi:hypothetical protein